MSIIRKIGVDYGALTGAIVTAFAGLLAWLGIQQQIAAQNTNNDLVTRGYLSAEEDRLQRQKWASEESRRLLLLTKFIYSSSCSQKKSTISFMNSDLYKTVSAQTPLDINFIRDNLSGPAARDIFETIYNYRALNGMKSSKFNDERLMLLTEKYATSVCSDFRNYPNIQSRLSQYIQFIDFRQSYFQKMMVRIDDQIASGVFQEENQTWIDRFKRYWKKS